MDTKEIISAEMLEGEPVVDSQGEEIGTVADVMIDPALGRVAYVVISRNAESRVIPSHALRRDSARRLFVAKVVANGAAAPTEALS